ncbi:MAG: FadR family transcriptional regulator [Lachnospiraceae bacterium]|nr:FadR family transcriptional regulator [Lachnospiraceae bacterium]
MANDLGFDKVERQSLSDQVIERIKSLLMEGKLLPGDRLPPERDLAQSFGVSRASVREAIHSLSTMGILESRVGDGTYVSDNSQTVLEQLSWAVYMSDANEAQLKEARKLIEPAIAGLAAERATKDDVARLAEILKKMEASLGDPVIAAGYDYEFHVALAEIAGNEILQGILVGLQWMLRTSIQKKLKENPDLDVLCLSEHRDIFKAIQQGDTKKAKKAMRLSVNESKLDAEEK